MINAVAFVSILLLALPVLAQVDCNGGLEPIEKDAPSRLSALEFTRAVAAKEAAIARAFTMFGYKVEVSVQTVEGDAADGEFRQAFTVSFDDTGTRAAKPVESAANTLSRLTLSAKDVDTFVNAPPFALTADVLAEKDAVYSGRQRLGDHNASVFDLLRRNDQAPLRGFAGRVWMWASRSAILRSCGRAAAYPIGPLRYEIRRERVGEENWFPIQIRADEDAGPDDRRVHVRVNVKYSDYKPR